MVWSGYINSHSMRDTESIGDSMVYGTEEGRETLDVIRRGSRQPLRTGAKAITPAMRNISTPLLVVRRGRQNVVC